MSSGNGSIGLPKDSAAEYEKQIKAGRVVLIVRGAFAPVAVPTHRSWRSTEASVPLASRSPTKGWGTTIRTVQTLRSAGRGGKAPRSTEPSKRDHLLTS